MSDSTFLTPAEAASILRVDPATVTRLLGQDKLPGLRVGKQWRIVAGELADFLRNHRNLAPRAKPLFGYQSRDGHHTPCVHCGEPASEHECPEVISDRYDSQHPESEHDGGLGSGDWVGPWEDRR